MSLGLVGVVHATRQPADIVKNAEGPNDPTITVSEASYSLGAEKIGLRLTVTISNPGTKYLARETCEFDLQVYPVLGGQTGECHGKPVRITIPRLTDASGTTRSFATVKPGRSEWFAIELNTPNEEQTRQRLANARALGIKGSICLVDGKVQLSCQIRDINAMQR